MATKLKEGQNGVNGTASHPKTATAAVSPLKESPAVERALARSKLYLLLSWSYLYPEDDEFLDYLQSGEFVEDGRAALENLRSALESHGGEDAQENLDAIAKHFDEVENWASSEGVNWGIQDLRDEHRK